MRLKETFYRKVVDPVLCPPQVIFKDGSDPLAKSTLSKLMSRSDFLLPLLGSTSFIAIDRVAFGGSSMETGLWFLSGHLFATWFNHITGRGSLDSDITEPIKKNKIKYYIDRTNIQKQPIDNNVLLDLQLRNDEATLHLIARPLSAGAAIAIVLPLFPSVFLSSGLGLFANDLIKPMAAKWQNKRTLEGEWSINKEPPKEPAKQKIKTPVPTPSI